jgi:Asp-tRNA(Asn)/Glu-tRNA(Gln) amidotransferase A subunit family amidase
MRVIAVISQRTRLFDITGYPAITIPWKLDPEGMPIGVQLIGPRDEDGRVLEIAGLFEPDVTVDARFESYL